MQKKKEGQSESTSGVDVLGFVGGTTLTGVIGAVSAPGLGLGTFAAAAGGLGLIAASCATGAAILVVPWALIHAALEVRISSAKVNENFWLGVFFRTLQISMGIGVIVGAALLGAVVLGACANPIGASILAGLLVAAIAVVGIIALCGLFAAPVIASAVVQAKKQEDIFTPAQVTEQKNLLQQAHSLDYHPPVIPALNKTRFQAELGDRTELLIGMNKRNDFN